ncbi:MAG: carboxypeptidase regulatory-like domain-containing protein [Ignavibacteriota bacterium]
MPAFGQVTAAISGKVEDPSGAAIKASAVTVKNLETGATRTAVSDESGSFRTLSLPIGPYEVRAEKPGFRTEVRSGINLAVGQEAVVKLRLEVGDLAQVVNVTEATSVVNTTTSSVSGLVGEREVKDLPLNGRSFDDLMTLNPGVINYSLKSANTSTSNGNTFSVDGRRPADNLVLLNGIEYTGSSQLAITPGGVSGYLLGIDAVREFNVQTDTYGAEYGKRSGRAGHCRHAVRNQRATWHAVRISTQQRSRLAQYFRADLVRSAIPSESIRRRPRGAAQKESPLPFRELRGLSPGANAEQRERGARCAGTHGPIPQLRGNVCAGGESE